MGEFIIKNNDIIFSLKNTLTTLKGNPFQHLRHLRRELRCANTHHLTHLVGAAVGYFSYDAIRYIEAIPDCHHSLKNMPDIDLKFYRDSVSSLILKTIMSSFLILSMLKES